MSWKYKMESVLKGCLGSEYSLKIINDNTFEIYFHGKSDLKRTSIHSLESHWRYEIKEALKIKFEKTIEYNLSLV